jgi:MFS family permease
MRVIIAASGFFAAAALIAALMPTFWTFAASTILLGFATVTILTTANGYVQTTTEIRLRGRVLALYMAVMMGGTPIGAPIVGAVVDALGPRWGLGVASLAAAIAAIIGLSWLVAARGMRVGRHPDVRWRPSVRFADAPTAAIAVEPTRPVEVLRSTRLAPDQQVEPARRLEPADFSEEIALTTPIPLPTLPQRDAEEVGTAARP